MIRFYEVGIIALIGVILSIPMSAYAGGNETGTLHKGKSSDGTCTNGIVLTTQAEVDAYPATYGCSQVPDLFILGNDITNLDSLYQVTTITHA